MEPGPTGVGGDSKPSQGKGGGASRPNQVGTGEVHALDTHSLEDPIEPLYDARIRGAAVIGTAVGGRVHLHGGCWVSPCAGDPPQLMVAFPKEFEGARLVRQAGALSVSLLATDDAGWLGRFFQGEQAIRPESEARFLRSSTGCPVLAGAVAYFDCHLVQALDLGDFLLAVGDVVAGDVLHPERRNLTVNEIIAERDPRGTDDATLPFEGFDFDMGRLAAAPGGPVSPHRFQQLYAHRAWGLFFVSAAQGGRGHFHIGGSMMQTSHEPPRMAIALRKTWEGSAWISSGAPFAMTLIADDQIGLVRRFAAGAQSAAALAGDRRPLGDGLFTLRQGIAWFRCRPEMVRDVGDCFLVVAPVEQSEWLRQDATNLTDAGLAWILPVSRESEAGFSLHDRDQGGEPCVEPI